MVPLIDHLMHRPLYAYHLPPELLESIELKSDAGTGADDDAGSAVATTVEAKDADPPSAKSLDSCSSDVRFLVGSQACSLCALTFTNVIDHRGHLKSDHHNYNIKQKLRHQKPVSETEFEKLIQDLDESLSGSDSDDSDGDSDDEQDDANDTTLAALLKRQARIADRNNATTEDQGQSTVQRRHKSPLLWFSSALLPKNHFLGLYRAIFTDQQQKNPDAVAELRAKQLQPQTVPQPAKDKTLSETAYKGSHIFMCMIGGGHFAAMVVSLAPRQSGKHATTMDREAVVLAAKTFHRYTTRRKQGGSQSANDNAKGAAHSAGATLRRYNEQALVDDVRQLLRDWKPLIDSSELVFVRATGITNRRALYGPYENQVLRQRDPRIRGFPFNTKRPTQKELMRCFIELTRLKVREIDPTTAAKSEAAAAAAAAASPPPAPPPKPAKPKLSEEEQSALLHTSQIQAFIRRSKLPALLSYLSGNKLSADFELQPRESHHHAPRPLHLAASQNSAPLALGLLTRGGASPVLRSAEGRTAFELAGDRATRDAFRVARGELGEDKWDWEAARVPAALSQAEADRRAQKALQEAEAREAERRRAEEERLRTQGPRVAAMVPEGQGRRRTMGGGGGVHKTAQEAREDEARGLTPEMKMRLDRERRARAAEERLRKMRQG